MMCRLLDLYAIMYKQTKQYPTISKYGEKSISREVISGINLTGETAIGTGGSTGTGEEIAKTLAYAGAKVIVATRNTTKAQKVFLGIKNIAIENLDLMDPKSISRCNTKYKNPSKYWGFITGDERIE